MGKEKKEGAGGGGGGGGGLCSTLRFIMCILRKRELGRMPWSVGEAESAEGKRPALFLFRRHNASASAPKTHFFIIQLELHTWLRGGFLNV